MLFTHTHGENVTVEKVEGRIGEALLMVKGDRATPGGAVAITCCDSASWSN